MNSSKPSSFIINNEKLMSLWDWEKNNELGLDPNKIKIYSKEKVWWKCENGHEWCIAPIEITTRDANCPYCHDRKVLTGLNDLETKYPELAKEWDYVKNGDLKPSDVLYKSSLNVWWKCSKCSHEWQAPIIQRSLYGHRGCSNCKSGLSTSFPEQAIYYYVKKLYPDAISRYKDIFDNGSELDIYVPSLKVGIEYDGMRFHNQNDPLVRDREKRKYQTCKENGIKLIRVLETPNKRPFPGNCDVSITRPTDKSDDENLEDLIYFLLTNMIKNQMTTSTIEETLGILPFDINIERDRYEILSYLNDLGESSLAALYPDIAKEWHPTKNGNVTPSMVSPGSNYNAWWKCSYCGKEFKKAVCTRTASGRLGCKKCSMGRSGKDMSKKYIAEHGSFAENFPEIAKQWDYEKNGDVTPDTITTNTKKYWWKCPKCGNEWQASTQARSKEHGPGCPVCCGRVANHGVNDLATLYPDSLNEWDYDKNKELGLDPGYLLPYSSKKAWWKCQKCGYEWQAIIGSHMKGHGCPHCAGQVPIVGVDDFATEHPELLKEWDYSKNTDIDPTQVKSMSGKKVWWICSTCGNEWKTSICNRSKGKGCDYCGHKRGGQKHHQQILGKKKEA